MFGDTPEASGAIYVWPLNDSRFGARMKKISSFFLPLLICTTSIVLGQGHILDSSASSKPTWVVSPPIGHQFKYYTGLGSSNTSLQQAQENAIGGVLQQLVEEGTFNVQIKSSSETGETILRRGTESSDIISDNFIREVVRTGTSKQIQGLKKIETYWQTVNTSKGLEYQFWVLIGISKPGVDSNNFIQQGYGFAPVWRSTILPGWGQRYKGEIRKGNLLMISTLSTAAATFFSFYLSSVYGNKAETERDLDNRKYYNNWSSQTYSLGIATGLLAGGLYGYNIFDAISAPGAKKYAEASILVSPIVALADQSFTGVRIQLHF